MNINELKALINQHPVYIPIREVAKFLGASETGLRASIDQGRCPFGFSWTLGSRSGYKVPTLAFVSWITKGTIQLDI